jgi:hypothetical protein
MALALRAASLPKSSSCGFVRPLATIFLLVLPD